MKLLLLIVIGYLCYRAFKSWMAGAAGPRRPVGPGDRPEIDDVMIQDPYCGTYFPQRDGVSLRINGKTLYFCSEKCRDAFVAENKEIQ